MSQNDAVPEVLYRRLQAQRHAETWQAGGSQSLGKAATQVVSEGSPRTMANKALLSPYCRTVKGVTAVAAQQKGQTIWQKRKHSKPTTEIASTT